MSVQLLSKPLQVERTEDGRRRLLRALKVSVDGKVITIPAGTVTDYSSVPFGMRNLVRWDRIDIAGVVHDYLYQTGMRSRRKADAVWRKVAMGGSNGANPFQAWVGWLGLRIGGWVAWRKHRAAS